MPFSSRRRSYRTALVASKELLVDMGGRGIPIVSLRRMSRPIATLRPATPADIGAIDLPIT
jgi:hypothetical protein